MHPRGIARSAPIRSLAVPLLLAWVWASPALAQGDPHQHHPHHSPVPIATHNQAVGPAGVTYDLRWLDAMVQHHPVHCGGAVGDERHC